MRLAGYVTREALEDAVRDAGGTVCWGEVKPGSAEVGVMVDVDPEYAASEASWYVPHLRGEFDVRDVRDFAEAAASGDRQIALALASRLFVFDTEISAVERGLSRPRGRA